MCPPATWPNNDTDTHASQGLSLEKVKNLYRTAAAVTILRINAATTLVTVEAMWRHTWMVLAGAAG